MIAESGTSLTEVYGVGPVVAATVLGYVGDIRRFASRDHFAAYNGTAPIEASSGNRIVHRLSRRGNRQLNHAIHLAAVTQIRNPDTTGRAYYDRKIAEGMPPKSALRALKRKVSDALYARMTSDATRSDQARQANDPGGQTGNDSASSAAGSHPDAPALRASHSRARPTLRPATSHRSHPHPNDLREQDAEPLDVMKERGLAPRGLPSDSQAVRVCTAKEAPYERTVRGSAVRWYGSASAPVGTGAYDRGG
jgi:hypothetical protein